MPVYSPSSDQVATKFTLYIEGVQVPFMAIAITSGASGMPSANIQIPSAPFLMDIAKWYQPKVHVFYFDKRSTQKDQTKLLFSGIISNVTYTKSTESNTNLIEFSCTHKYSPLSKLQFNYAGFLAPQAADNVMNLPTFSSVQSIVEALRGLNPPDPSSAVTYANAQSNRSNMDVATCPPYLSSYYGKHQYSGLPGACVNLWNQIKWQPYVQPDNYLLFGQIYKPLVQEGLQFFQRMTGHSAIEMILDGDRQNAPCGSKVYKVVLPPVFHNLVSSAAAVDMAVSHMQSFMQYSGEATDLLSVYTQMLEGVDYDMLFLTSPIKNPYDDPIDVVVRPRLPFYYSPSCNVYYPYMYDSLNVSYDEANTPSRLQVLQSENFLNNASDVTTLDFRAPADYRLAIAAAAAAGKPKMSLQDTALHLGTTNGAYSVFEQARGAVARRMTMPQWLQYYISDQSIAKDASGSGNITADQQTILDALDVGWQLRWANVSQGQSMPNLVKGSPPPSSTDALDPYNPAAAGIQAWESMLFASADYFFTQETAATKAGTLDGPFNPYIIPGYPMDIIDGNPTSPSFHAYCMQVVHTIDGGGSARTTVQFVSAVAYTELSNYFIPIIPPWLAYYTGLAELPSIINNPTAKAFATDYYNTLGVDVYPVAPDDIFDFATGLAKPLTRAATGELVQGSPVPEIQNGRDLNPATNYEGSLFNCFREIESKSDIEAALGVKFMDIIPSATTAENTGYVNPILNQTKGDLSKLMSLGQNQFLTYRNLGPSSSGAAADTYIPNLAEQPE